MHRFLVITDKADGNYSAYSPDLPGCVATGKTRDKAEMNMYEAVRLHLDGLVEDGEPIPDSVSSTSYVALPSNASRVALATAGATAGSSV